MATFGKVLLFFNILAAGALTYLATQDWAKRQSLTATALQYYLTVRGLPLETPVVEADPDENPLLPLRVETSGGYTTEFVRTSFLKTHFAQADGGELLGGATKPVTSQFDELKRVEDKAVGLLTGMDSDAKRLAQLCGKYSGDPATGRPTFTPGWLHTLAESFAEREAVRALARSAPDAVPAAAKTADEMFKKKFAIARTKPDPKFAAKEAEDLPKNTPTILDAFKKDPNDKAVQATFYADLSNRPITAPRDDGDQRRRIAQLLFLLDPSEKWQKRVALVVGLKTYAQAVADQATRLDQMARTAIRLIEVEDIKFVDEYSQMKQFAADRTVILEQQTVIRQNLDDQKVKDEEATKVRKMYLADRQADLAKIKAEVADKLAAQAEVERKLFEVEQRVGETLRRNFELEDKLDAAETQKLGGGK